MLYAALKDTVCAFRSIGCEFVWWTTEASSLTDGTNNTAYEFFRLIRAKPRVEDFSIWEGRWPLFLQTFKQANNFFCTSCIRQSTLKNAAYLSSKNIIHYTLLTLSCNVHRHKLYVYVFAKVDFAKQMSGSSNVLLKPPTKAFSSPVPKAIKFFNSGSRDFRVPPRANTWIVSSFRVEALGQSSLGAYRLPCEELWDACMRSMWHFNGPKSNAGYTVKGRHFTGLQQNLFPRRKKVQLQLWLHEQMQSLIWVPSFDLLVIYTTGQRFFLCLTCF